MHRGTAGPCFSTPGISVGRSQNAGTGIICRPMQINPEMTQGLALVGPMNWSTHTWPLQVAWVSHSMHGIWLLRECISKKEGPFQENQVEPHRSFWCSLGSLAASFPLKLAGRSRYRHAHCQGKGCRSSPVKGVSFRDFLATSKSHHKDNLLCDTMLLC